MISDIETFLKDQKDAFQRFLEQTQLVESDTDLENDSQDSSPAISPKPEAEEKDLVKKNEIRRIHCFGGHLDFLTSERPLDEDLLKLPPGEYIKEMRFIETKAGLCHVSYTLSTLGKKHTIVLDGHKTKTKNLYEYAVVFSE